MTYSGSPAPVATMGTGRGSTGPGTPVSVHRAGRATGSDSAPTVSRSASRAGLEFRRATELRTGSPSSRARPTMSIIPSESPPKS